MHDGMHYNSIQGQGHEPLKVGNLAIFKSFVFRNLQMRWQLTTNWEGHNI